MLNSKLNKAQVVLIVVILLAFLGALAYFKFLPYWQKYDFEKNYNEAVMLNSKGQYDEAITKLENLVAGAPDTITLGRAKIKLAFALFNRNQGNDAGRAIDVLDGTYKDVTLPPVARALALANMMYMLDLPTYSGSARTYIFRREPYALAMRESRGSYYLASKSFYDQSDKLYKNSLAELELAAFYGNQLLAGSVASGTVKEVAEKAKNYAQSGLSLLGDVPYEPNQKSFLYLLGAISFGVSSKYLPDVSYDLAEQNFKNSISVGELDSSGDGLGQAMLSRLYYASFNFDHYGVSGLGEVKSILKPFMIKSYGQIPIQVTSFLKNQENMSRRIFFRIQLMKIAREIPEFKSFLEKDIGWVVKNN